MDKWEAEREQERIRQESKDNRIRQIIREELERFDRKFIADIYAALGKRIPQELPDVNVVPLVVNEEIELVDDVYSESVIRDLVLLKGMVGRVLDNPDKYGWFRARMENRNYYVLNISQVRRRL